ncbi:hypothetical protein [Crinalium epipsammum]|nr:hypothetical protein [Crinalium epipsammum]
MLKMIGRLNSESQKILVKRSTLLIEKMEQDVSRYAPGRHRIWLFHQANLQMPPETTEAYFDQFFWKISQKIYPGCQIALLTFGGKSNEINSDARIDWHRDHTYAEELAFGINFGGKAEFGYDFNRQAGDRRTIELAPGDVYKFNCKHTHALLSHEAQRFSLILWKIRKDKRYPGLKICDRISKLLTK